MKVGDIVCFAIDAPEKREYCGVWSWAHGLLLQIDDALKYTSVMDINGKVHQVVIEHVQEIGEGHWHPGMPTDEARNQSRRENVTE